MASVLVIDTFRDIRETERAMLETRGHTVEAFSDSSEAIVQADFSSVDLVVADIYAPAVPGYRILEYFQDIGCRIPVVITGGYLPENVTEMVRELGACDVLTKPFKLDVFLDSVEKNLSS